MSTTHHFFLSETGEMLPRWRQAFPRAFAIQTTEVKSVVVKPEVIWLRLRADFSVFEQLSTARKQFGEQMFIVLSDMPNDQEALAAFSAAARGYCNSHATPQVLQQVAAVVLQGGLWVGASLMQRLLTTSITAPLPTAVVEDSWTEVLTKRELEVARTVAAGASNKEIAAQLGITERTVKAHVGAILEKLKVRDRLQLAMLMRDQHAA